MSISGNYFERLLLIILPYTLLLSVIIYYIDKDLKEMFAGGSIFTGSLWLMDTLIIFIKYNPKTLRSGRTLKCGRRTISVHDIESLIPITDKRQKWSFNLVELNLNDGTTFIILDKPRTIISDLLDKPSGTIKRLKKKYPELEGKDRQRRYVH